MEGILFFFACCLFVASIVIYMRKEDNDYAKLLKKFEPIENSITDLETKLNGFIDAQRNLCAHMTSDIGDTMSKVRELEHRPTSMSVNFPKSIKFDPVQLIIKKEALPAPTVQSPKPRGIDAVIPQGKSLLDRAGIKTKLKKEVTQ